MNGSDEPGSVIAPESSVGIDAELLGAILTLLNQLLQQSSILTGLLRFDLVVDANVIGADLAYLVSRPNARRTRLQEIGASGLFHLHIPHWALTELETSTLPQIADETGVSDVALQDKMQDYLEGFQIHEEYKWPAVAVKAGVDPKDEPYIALARDIEASAILSRDKGIEDYGAIRFDIDELIAARLYARAASSSFNIKIAGVSATGLSIWGLMHIFGSLGVRFARLPASVQFLVVCGGLFALTRPQVKTALATLAPSWQMVCDLVGITADYIEEQDAQAKAALESLVRDLPVVAASKLAEPVKLGGARQD